MASSAEEFRNVLLLVMKVGQFSSGALLTYG